MRTPRPCWLLRANLHLDKNFYVTGRGKAATQNYLKLIKHLFPANIFCGEPCAFWEALMDLQEEQNAASPGRVHLGLGLFAQRIHHLGGLRNCLLQSYVLLEDSVQRDPTCNMVYAAPVQGP